MDNIFENRIKDKIDGLNLERKSIVVLKGIPLSVVLKDNEYCVDLEKAVKNKLQYLFFDIGERKFITYEEFLLLYNLIIEQYEVVYVIENNIYMDQYPIDMYYCDITRQGLINHFVESDEENDDIDLGNIGEFISIYDGIKEYNGYYLGAYCDSKIEDSTKVFRINLFDVSDKTINIKKDTDSEKFVISEEAQYIDFVRYVFNEPDEVVIDITSYVGDANKLKEHIKILAEYWGNWTEFYYSCSENNLVTYQPRPEFKELLQKYWKHSEFRDLKVYDLNSLPDKKLMNVSQEKIINDLVEQAEKASNGTDYRDIFVTAPTGAGKSVMFQIPAIYLAEKYEWLTIVISPLIGLMNDQVYNLNDKNYVGVQTINSDMTSVVKDDIKQRIKRKEIHILYISPETLLSRSDVSELIGDRKIGMVVIDEAHIVTTWGKQFRPDYWYLGDYIRKLRKNQESKFAIATFTATVIYHGIEDMFTETINSLHMINPIVYLGHMKRDDITINIDRTKPNRGERAEYELDKFEEIFKIAFNAILLRKKVLVYFPTVKLIDRCFDFLKAKNQIVAKCVAKYHGLLSKDKKEENYRMFKSSYNPENSDNNNLKYVMLATKEFGMGVDINDIEQVVHFAPTGNVCDYLQEVGRAARRDDLVGEAYYHYNTKDFKHINRLHGLSTIKKYQLIEVLVKIDELYAEMRKNNKGLFTRKSNSMLLDAENFSYIFKSRSDDGGDINKVKTALLMIQKDFESKKGFSPINVRPVPMFAYGYFQLSDKEQHLLQQQYPNSMEQVKGNNVYSINLKYIWEKSYQKKYSFPQFKYLLYTRSEDLDLVKEYQLIPVVRVFVKFEDEYKSNFKYYWLALRNFISRHIIDGDYVSIGDIAEYLHQYCKINIYKAEAIAEVVVASMSVYREKFVRTSSKIVQEKATNRGHLTYCFYTAANQYFDWVDKKFNDIMNETIDGELYLIDNVVGKTAQYNVVLGILETMDILSFKMLGGANSQLYIYINQIENIKNIINNPRRYENSLLNTVNDRHDLSVKMLTYLYESDFQSEEIWDILEDYFLGVVPEKVKQMCRKDNPNMILESIN